MPGHDTANRDKVVVVTGGASGIGRATALVMAEAGWGTIALLDRATGRTPS